jgi:phospholipase/carboxylesterase
LAGGRSPRTTGGLESGMPPSFRRFTEPGLANVRSRTEELAQFIRTVCERYGFSTRMVFGYSHGANRAASLILLHPHYLAGAVLFPGLMPLLPDLIRNFSHVSVFIGAAHLNPIIPSGQAEELSATFQNGGANLTISWHQGRESFDEVETQALRIGSPNRRSGGELARERENIEEAICVQSTTDRSGQPLRTSSADASSARTKSFSMSSDCGHNARLGKGVRQHGCHFSDRKDHSWPSLADVCSSSVPSLGHSSSQLEGTAGNRWISGDLVSRICGVRGDCSSHSARA